jgi:16S rRNA (adenine1518-N6/adenine1519-N6)-dimethyltransferase
LRVIFALLLYDNRGRVILGFLANRDLRSEARRWFRARRSHPRKSRGQHFMVSAHRLSSIAEAAAAMVQPRPQVAVEFGPGLGFLTAFLLRHFERVVAVEIDRWFVEHLQQTFQDSPGLTVVHQDFLRFPLAEVPDPYIVVGNLPFNLSTPVLELLTQCPSGLVGAALVVQREFADRAAALPGSREFGRLSLFLQNHFVASLGPIIEPAVFYPRPKVASRLLLLLRQDVPLVPAHLTSAFDRVVRTAFSARRKMLRTALASLLPRARLLQVLEDSRISGTLRPETLSFSDWVALCKVLGESEVIR